MRHTVNALLRPSNRDGSLRFAAHLPLQSTPFIGREQDCAAASEILLRGDVRLLTLTGPPGAGKTRLGLQIAADVLPTFADGIYFVPLAPVRDAHLVVAAISQSMEFGESGTEPLLERLKRALQEKHVLLLLDNFEHVGEAAPQVAELLAACPQLKVLATSRELLHLYGEHDYQVPLLTLPASADPARLLDLAAFSRCEAVALFLQRAQAVSPGFQLADHNAPAIAGICLRLDGLPLAIELAAARILVLPPEELLVRLKSRLTLLTGGARNLPERQRTLRATIDWSYNLLDPGEQALFSRLGVFVGGCTLQGIADVCGSGDPGEAGIDILDGVTSLVGKSLLQRQDSVPARVGTEPRFVMLETIREYAREKLEERGEHDLVRDRHFDHFLQFAEAAEQETLGQEQTAWMQRLDADLNNLRAALEWSLSLDGPGGGRRAAQGLRLGGALGRYWQSRSYLSEGRQWCTQLLSQTAPAAPSVERAKVLRTLARLIYEQGDFTEARALYEQSLAMVRTLGDDWGIATSLLGLGNVAMWQGEYDVSRTFYDDCLAIGRTLGSRPLISSALSMIGTMLMRTQEYHAARSPLEDALAIERELGNTTGIADMLIKQGSVALHLGEYERAKALIEESLGIARELGAEWIIAISLARFGLIALRQGDPQRAETFLVEGLARARDSGIRRWSRWYLVGLAEIARLRGLPMRAARLIGASDGGLSAAGAHYEPATHSEIERIIASVRAELDEETFATLGAEGRAMSFKEVTAYVGSPTEAGSTLTAAGQQPYQVYPDDLTAREVEVLRLVAVGKSNQEIGQALVLSRRTVERHISNIYQKIGASGKVARATATAYAHRHGIST